MKVFRVVTDGRWHPGVMCDISSIAYSFMTRVGLLFMASDQCCDMAGCIELFERIDMKCRQIETIAGDGERDTMYVRDERGWRAKPWHPDYEGFQELDPPSFIAPGFWREQ